MPPNEFIHTQHLTIAPYPTMLPQDVLGEISLYLPLESFLVFRKVCQQFLEATKRPARINEAFLRAFFVNVIKSLSIIDSLFIDGQDSQKVVFNIRDSSFYEEKKYFLKEECFLPTDITPSEFRAIPTRSDDKIIHWLLMSKISNNQVVMKKIPDAMAKFVMPSINRLAISRLTNRLNDYVRKMMNVYEEFFIVPTFFVGIVCIPGSIIASIAGNYALANSFAIGFLVPIIAAIACMMCLLLCSLSIQLVTGSMMIDSRDIL